MVGEQQSSTWPKNPQRLTDRGSLVGDAAQRKRADHRVEAVVHEGQRRSVALLKGGRCMSVGRPATGNVEHGPAPVDTGHVDAGWVVGKVGAGPNAHFEGASTGATAYPVATLGEHPSLDAGHLLVVRRSLPVPESDELWMGSHERPVCLADGPCACAGAKAAVPLVVQARRAAHRVAGWVLAVFP